MRWWIAGCLVLVAIALLVMAFHERAAAPRPAEDALAPFLPKDRDLSRSAVELAEKPKIRVELKRGTGDLTTLVVLDHDELGRGRDAFAALDRRIGELHEADADLPGEINAWAAVPRADIVRAIDAFMKHGVTDITFVGAPPAPAPVTPR